MVFYPLTVLQQILPGSLILFAQLNPLSTVSDLIRGYLMGTLVTVQSWVETSRSRELSYWLALDYTRLQSSVQ